MLDLTWISPVYREKAAPAEIVRDFIAGMTDRYLEYVFNKIAVPQRVKGRFSMRFP
jgi:dGTP triphosphohydrolase